MIDAFEVIGNRLRAVPGYLASELLQSTANSTVFAVLSAWSGWEQFLAWEQGQAHPEQTSPLRQYQDRSRSRPFEILSVIRTSS